MEIKINVDDIRPKKLFVATPMYGGSCSGMFCKSTNDLSMAAAKYGLDIRFYYLFNESLIPRARNYCVDEFLRSDCTHMLFIDADIGFNYKDALALLHLCDENKYSVITAPYPKKTIAWEKVKKAVERGYGENPFELENFIGDYVFNPAEGITEFRIDEPVKVREAGTGFMMMHRSVFERYEKAFPELKYIPDHVRTEHFDGEREIMAYFDCLIDPVSRRYLSEDYMFCYNVQKTGLDVWMCPWMQLKHVGSYVFGGSMSAIAAIEASPTASSESKSHNYLTPKETDVKVSPLQPQLSRQQRRAAMKKGKR